MKKIFSLLSASILPILLLSSMLMPNLAKAGGWYSSYLSLIKNGENIQYDMVDDGGNVLPGVALGEVISLSLVGGSFNVWCDPNDPSGGQFIYRLKDLTAGAYVGGSNWGGSATNMNAFGISNNAPGSDFNCNLTCNIDLVAGLIPTHEYRLEVWVQAWSGSCGDQYLPNNYHNLESTQTLTFSIPDGSSPVAHLSGISKVFMFNGEDASTGNWYQGGSGSPYGSLNLIQGANFDIDLDAPLYIGVEIATTPAAATDGVTARMAYIIDEGEIQYINTTYVAPDGSAAKWQSSATQVANIADGLSAGVHNISAWYEAIEVDVDTFYYTYQPGINYSFTVNIDDGIVLINNIVDAYIFTGDSATDINGTWYKTHGDAELSEINGHVFNIEVDEVLNIGAKIAVNPLDATGVTAKLGYVIDEGTVNYINMTFVGEDENNLGNGKFETSAGNVVNVASGLSEGDHSIEFWFEALIPDIDTNYYNLDMFGGNFVATIHVGEVVIPVEPLTGIAKAFVFNGDSAQDIAAIWYKTHGDAELAEINGATFNIEVGGILNIGAEIATTPASVSESVIARMGYIIDEEDAEYINMTYITADETTAKWQSIDTDVKDIAAGLAEGDHSLELWFEALQAGVDTFYYNISMDGGNFVATIHVGEIIIPETEISHIGKAMIFNGAAPDESAEWFWTVGNIDGLNGIHGYTFNIEENNTLNLGAEIFVLPADAENVTGRMGYVIDDCETCNPEAQYIEMTNLGEDVEAYVGAIKLQTSLAQIVDVANGLSVGTHTIGIWFEAIQGDITKYYNLNVDGDNFIANIVVSPATMTLGGLEEKVIIFSNNNVITANFSGIADVQMYDLTGKLLASSISNNQFVKQVKSGVYMLIINGKANKVVVR